MAYTPELELRYSRILRRIAWALDCTMGKAQTEIIEWVARNLDSNKICNKCRDKTKCEECLFNR